MNRLSTTGRTAIDSTSNLNTSPSLGTVQDVNVATLARPIRARGQVRLAQAGASVLAQANQAPQLALKLLQ